MGPDTDAARGLAKDGDVAGVAAEARDVLPHPAERGLLVHDAVIAGRVALGIDGRVGEEAEHVEAVVQRDADDALGHERAGVVAVGAAHEQPAAWEPDHDRALVPVPRAAGCEHVEEQAIFRLAVIGEARPSRAALRTHRAKGDRLQTASTSPRAAAADASAGRRRVGRRRGCRGSSAAHPARRPSPLLGRSGRTLSAVPRGWSWRTPRCCRPTRPRRSALRAARCPGAAGCATRPLRRPGEFRRGPRQGVVARQCGLARVIDGTLRAEHERRRSSCVQSSTGKAWPPALFGTVPGI